MIWSACELKPVLRAAIMSVRWLLLGAFLVVVGAPPAQAQVRDRCSDKSASGTLECSWGPQIIEPWKYEIPGPIHSSGKFLDEEAAKEAYGGYLKENCPTCCDPGSLIDQGDWQEASFTNWGQDYPVNFKKPLSYRVVPRISATQCGTPWTFTTVIGKTRGLGCDLGWTVSQYDPPPAFCYRVQRPCQECRTSHPISMPTASKVFKEVDYIAPLSGRLSFVREYRSEGFGQQKTSESSVWRGPAHLGASWTHNYAGLLLLTPNSVRVEWGQEPPRHFSLPSQQGTYPRELPAMRRAQGVRLIEMSADRYVYYTADNRMVIYEGGRPVSIHLPSGWTTSLTYGFDVLTSAQDASGRRLQFLYYLDWRLAGFIDPAGNDVRYEYKPPMSDGSGRPYQGIEYSTLTKVIFQDHSTRGYVVPNWRFNGASNNDNFLATRITAIVDENNVVFQTISYDVPGGGVRSTVLAGGVDQHTVSGSSITGPLGETKNYYFGTTATTQELTSLYQPAGSGSAASSTQRTYDDVTGNLVSSTDFSGNKTCYAYEANSRSVERVRVEGLSTYAACSSSTPDNAVLPTGSRKTSTQWHPDWRLKTKVAEPGRITTSIYNGQPDPFNGGAAASCAPASALLPDGKPIAVLCKQVEQATTDADGSKGFAAVLQAGVAARVQQWTYNDHGQVLTATDPRGNVTSYAYYPDTTADHTRGDLQSVTTANGLITQYPKYNPHGQVLQSVDPNGVATDYTYDLRQRLTSVSTLGQTTTYTYWPTGLLKQVTLPDSSHVRYDYDDAHRLTDVTDNLGNSVHYTLDNAGNRINEQTKDATGALSRSLSRVMDALSRVQQTTGRE